MTTINFAYDKAVIDSHQAGYHKNIYDNKFYPINGLYDDCYYDYHAPLQTVFGDNGVTTKSVTLKEALSNNEPFIYMITFRYLAGTLFNMDNHNLFDHFPIGLVKAVNNGRCLLVLNDSHESHFYETTFYNALHRCINKAGILFDNILLLTGNVNNHSSNENIKVLFWQFFETAMRLSSRNNNIDVTSRYTDIESVKKFLCLNRIPRETRYYFMYQMYKHNLISNFRASLNKVNDISNIVSHHDGMFLNEIKDDPKFTDMLASLPWTVDTDKFDNNHWDTVEQDFSLNNIIFVTTETLFANGHYDLFLTEKTFKPIALKMPFILIGTSGILRRLRDIGYKTFDTLWDESYDDEDDPTMRMQKIISLVKDISTKYSTKELADLITSNNDILEHNHSMLMCRRPEAEIIKYIKEYICKYQ